MGEVVVYVDDLLKAKAAAYTSYYECRICHEEEIQGCKSLEAPCSCSGTVKFAHRDCIQRWCYEKGNTTCEICLQKFEPGYIAPPTKSQLIDAVVTIRGSLQVPRRQRTQQNQETMLENNSAECSSPADHGAKFCRSLALIFTVLLLLKHLIVEFTGDTQEYPFSLVAVLLIRASGIIIPMCILTRIITAIQRSINHHFQDQLADEEDTSSSDEDEEDESLTGYRYRV